MVDARWTWDQTPVPLECACFFHPLTLGMVPASGTHEVTVRRGKPVQFKVGISNLAKQPVLLRHPLALRVLVEWQQPLAGNRVREVRIWEGDLPPITGTLGFGAYSLSFSWNQHDARGVMVPRGSYVVRVDTPLTFAYATGGTSGTETLPANGMEIDGEHWDAVVNVGP